MTSVAQFLKANEQNALFLSKQMAKGSVSLISPFLFPHRENGVPILSLSDQKDIALELKVNNKGEDAYEAQLTASFPKSLSYSAVRTKSSVSPAARYRTYSLFVIIIMTNWFLSALKSLQEKPISCLANQNGSQADCDLGNPFVRNAEVNILNDI